MSGGMPSLRVGQAGEGSSAEPVQGGDRVVCRHPRAQIFRALIGPENQNSRRTRNRGLLLNGLRRKARRFSPDQGVEAATDSGAPGAPQTPKAGLFTPKDEKAFVKGVTAFTQGDRPNRTYSLHGGDRDSAEKHIPRNTSLDSA